MTNNDPATFENVDGLLGNAYAPERNYPSSLGKYREFKFRSKPTPEYCVKITSSNDSSCGNHPKPSASWHGGAIELLHNGDVVATLPTRGQQLEYCLPIDEVDVANDQFEFKSTTTDGVCITSLTVNNEQLLVGQNDDQSTFWLDQNENHCLDSNMAGKSLTVQNGEIYYSECKKDFIRAGRLVYEGVTVYPNYDVSVDLYLEPNTNTGWSNVFGFQAENTTPSHANGKVVPGARIPAVWLHKGRFSNQRILIG